MGKRQSVPVSTLRSRLNERMWEQQKKREHKTPNKKNETVVSPGTATPGKFFFISFSLEFWRNMHRHFHIKMMLALIFVLAVGLSQQLNWTWMGSVVESARYVIHWDMDLSYVQDEIIPTIGQIDADSLLDSVNLAHPQNTFLPVNGEVASGFGVRENPRSGEKEMHYGLDITAKRGSRVRAISSGGVEEIREVDGVKEVVLMHDRGWISLYEGLQEVRVEEGERVRGGEVLGILSHRELWSSPHLYFEMRWEGRPQDPRAILQLD